MKKLKLDLAQKRSEWGQEMAKYFKASDYYPDDKDVYDFLNSQTRSITPLLYFLRSLNVFGSKGAEKEDLQQYISLMYLDWDSANRLVDITDIRDTEPKVRNTKFNISSQTDEIIAVTKRVKDGRHQKMREVYNISKHGDDVDIHVTYLDIDTSRTRVLQKRERELTITATATKEGLAFRYTDSERARSIIDKIINTISEKNAIKEVPERNIDISHIKDSEARVKFFKKLMTDISGFKLIDVKKLNVTRFSSLSDNEEDEIEDEVEEKLKKVIMYGGDLLTTTEFQDLAKQRFFISGAIWKSERVDGKEERVEFSAAFNNASEGKEFAYKVIGVYRLDDNGKFTETREKVFGAEKKQYLAALESSAYKALNTNEDMGDDSSKSD